MSDKRPSFQWYPKDFLTDENVELMSLEEQGAYRRLMDYEWLHKGLPNDIPALAKMCRISPARFKKIWPAISGCFKSNRDGSRLTHPRLAVERKKQDQWRAKSREGGKRSAQLRAERAADEWDGIGHPPKKPNPNYAKRAKRLRDARKIAQHTKEEWNRLVAAVVEAIGKACPRCEQDVTRYDKDHVIPIYQGGHDGISNLQPICGKCNSQKGPENTDWIAPYRPDWAKELKGGSNVARPSGNTSSATATPPAISVVKKTPSGSKKKHSLPRTWETNEKHKEMAAAARLDVEMEANKFRDHATATGRLLVDWNAGFRMWLRKANDFARPIQQNFGNEDVRDADRRAEARARESRRSLEVHEQQDEEAAEKNAALREFYDNLPPAVRAAVDSEIAERAKTIKPHGDIPQAALMGCFAAVVGERMQKGAA